MVVACAHYMMRSTQFSMRQTQPRVQMQRLVSRSVLCCGLVLQLQRLQAPPGRPMTLAPVAERTVMAVIMTACMKVVLKYLGQWTLAWVHHRQLHLVGGRDQA